MLKSYVIKIGNREIVQTAEIIEKNGLSFQDFWRYTIKILFIFLYDIRKSKTLINYEQSNKKYILSNGEQVLTVEVTDISIINYQIYKKLMDL